MGVGWPWTSLTHDSCSADPEHGGGVGSHLQPGEIPHYQRGTGGEHLSPSLAGRMGKQGQPQLSFLTNYMRPSEDRVGSCAQDLSLPMQHCTNGVFLIPALFLPQPIYLGLCMGKL